MKVRIRGIVDHQVTVPKDAYIEAKRAKKLDELMGPFFAELPIELTYAPVEESD